MHKRPVKEAKLLERLNLPKTPVNQVEEANQFLQDPVHMSMSQEPQVQDAKSRQKTHENKQKRVKRIRDKLKQTVKPESEYLMQQQRAIILKKMKKYQPTNSSFSLLYGQKREMLLRPRQAQPMSTKKIDLSQYDTIKRNSYKKLPGLSRVINSNYQKVKTKSTTNFDTISAPITQRIRSMHYFQKLRQIRQESLLLRDESQHLLHKTANTEKYLQRKFQRLKQHSHELVSGSKLYRLQQQINKSYKNRF